MIYTKNLKKISDDVYIDAEPTKDGKNPLEWRRSFNFIEIPLKQIKVVTGCTVHDRDFNISLAPTQPLKEEIKLFKPKISGGLTISAFVDYAAMRDTIYIVDPKNSEETFTPSLSGNEIIVTIAVGVPTNDKQDAPEGIYWEMLLEWKTTME